MMIFIRTMSGEPPCPQCGERLDNITKNGRLGCPNCYKHFEQRFSPYLQRVYGGAVHKGDIPGSAGAELRRERRKRSLEEALQAAISGQDFERCATLRDEIKELENIAIGAETPAEGGGVS